MLQKKRGIRGGSITHATTLRQKKKGGAKTGPKNQKRLDARGKAETQQGKKNRTTFLKSRRTAGAGVKKKRTDDYGKVGGPEKKTGQFNEKPRKGGVRRGRHVK